MSRWIQVRSKLSALPFVPRGAPRDTGYGRLVFRITGPLDLLERVQTGFLKALSKEARGAPE